MPKGANRVLVKSLRYNVNPAAGVWPGLGSEYRHQIAAVLKTSYPSRVLRLASISEADSSGSRARPPGIFFGSLSISGPTLRQSGEPPELPGDDSLFLKGVGR